MRPPVAWRARLVFISLARTVELKKFQFVTKVLKVPS